MNCENFSDLPIKKMLVMPMGLLARYLLLFFSLTVARKKVLTP